MNPSVEAAANLDATGSASAAVFGPQPTPPAAPSACPPPLMWAGVLEEFHKNAFRTIIPRSRYDLEVHSLGNGPPLYFLNGMGASHEIFCLLIWLLKEEFTCRIYDYPGTKSPIRARIKLGDLADDLFETAKMMGDNSFDLYATSFGSLVALEALQQQSSISDQSQAPPKIKRTIIQGGFAYRRLSLIERMLINLGLWLPGRMSAMPFRRAVQTHNHRRFFPPLDPTRFHFFLDLSGKVPIATVARHGSLIGQTNFRPGLSAIKTPILLIHCEGDGLVNERCFEELKSGLSNCQTEWLHTSGHIPYFTHPHRIAKLVKEFLNNPLNQGPVAP